MQGSQLLSNNTLNLQPSSGLSSRRNSRPTIRPLYRKDVFYAGSVSKLINESQQQQQQQSHLKRKRSSGGMISALPSYANFDEYRYVRGRVGRLDFTPEKQSILYDFLYISL